MIDDWRRIARTKRTSALRDTKKLGLDITSRVLLRFEAIQQRLFDRLLNEGSTFQDVHDDVKKMLTLPEEK